MPKFMIKNTAFFSYIYLLMLMMMTSTLMFSPATEEEAKQHDLIPKSSVSPSAVTSFNAPESDTGSPSERKSANLMTESESFAVRSF